MPPNVNDYRELIRRLDAFDARIAAELETLRRDAARPERSQQKETETETKGKKEQ